MALWTKKEQPPISPLCVVPEQAKELFEIIEMRSLTPDYFDRFAHRVAGLRALASGSWTIGLLHDADAPMDSPTPDPVVVTPVILLVTADGITMFDEASAEIVVSSSWDRMCRIDLKPVDDCDYQIFAISYFTSSMPVSERFSERPPRPLDRSEIGVAYLYMHANPSRFEEIDRHWRRAHIPQDMHQIPHLLA
jgi:hypothetical protein